MCRKDMVQINMDVFVEKFQPEQWEEYCRKKESKTTPTKHSESSRYAGWIDGLFDGWISTWKYGCILVHGQLFI